jgi:hypothetical protein
MIIKLKIFGIILETVMKNIGIVIFVKKELNLFYSKIHYIAQTVFLRFVGIALHTCTYPIDTKKIIKMKKEKN